jgi:proline racemase
MLTWQIPHRPDVVDSHTTGEPTRCVLSGGPHLGPGSLAKRLERLHHEHDVYRRAILCEPRGSDVLVGALLMGPAPRHISAYRAIVWNMHTDIRSMAAESTLIFEPADPLRPGVPE